MASSVGSVTARTTTSLTIAITQDTLPLGAVDELYISDNRDLYYDWFWDMALVDAPSPLWQKRVVLNTDGHSTVTFEGLRPGRVHSVVAWRKFADDSYQPWGLHTELGESGYGSAGYDPFAVPRPTDESSPFQYKTAMDVYEPVTPIPDAAGLVVYDIDTQTDAGWHLVGEGGQRQDTTELPAADGVTWGSQTDGSVIARGMTRARFFVDDDFEVEFDQRWWIGPHNWRGYSQDGTHWRDENRQVKGGDKDAWAYSEDDWSGVSRLYGLLFTGECKYSGFYLGRNINLAGTIDWEIADERGTPDPLHEPPQLYYPVDTLWGEFEVYPNKSYHQSFSADTGWVTMTDGVQTSGYGLDTTDVFGAPMCWWWGGWYGNVDRNMQMRGRPAFYAAVDFSFDEWNGVFDAEGAGESSGVLGGLCQPRGTTGSWGAESNYVFRLRSGEKWKELHVAGVAETGPVTLKLVRESDGFAYATYNAPTTMARSIFDISAIPVNEDLRLVVEGTGTTEPIPSYLGLYPPEGKIDANSEWSRIGYVALTTQPSGSVIPYDAAPYIAQDTSVAAELLTLAAVLHDPQVQLGVIVTPDTLTATFSLLDATVATTAMVTPDTVAAALTLYQPSVTVVGEGVIAYDIAPYISPAQQSVEAQATATAVTTAVVGALAQVAANAEGGAQATASIGELLGISAQADAGASVTALLGDSSLQDVGAAIVTATGSVSAALSAMVGIATTSAGGAVVSAMLGGGPTPPLHPFTTTTTAARWSSTTSAARNRTETRR